jgi:lipopolysaccharide transport system ATP-binding protein
VEARADGKVADQVGINQPIEINVHYEALRGGKVLIPNIHLFAEDGTLIFISHDWYSGWRDRPKMPGCYRTVFTVPGNFFSEGRVTVTVAISTYKPFQVHLQTPDAVAFTVAEAGAAITSRGDYAGHLPGVVRPLIEARTEIVGS